MAQSNADFSLANERWLQLPLWLVKGQLASRTGEELRQQQQADRPWLSLAGKWPADGLLQLVVVGANDLHKYIALLC